MLFLRQTQKASDFASDNRPFFDYILRGERNQAPVLHYLRETSEQQ